MQHSNTKRSSRRLNDHDVTGRVRISHPAEVLAATQALLSGLHPGLDLAPVEHAFMTFTRLYAGLLPGYVGCDTWYHDAQHSMDCALAMARLIDGHDRSEPPARRLGPRRAVLGVIIALFHDAGYIRLRQEKVLNGAEFTQTHVRRSGDFLNAYLPQIGFAAEAELASRVVHFTGYEIALDRINVPHPLDRMLGFLLGTADVLAQTADRCYLEKCRDCLYREFEICGMAGAARPGMPPPIYSSTVELLQKTPEFNRKLWEERLDGYFGGVHRYLETHFDGRNPYADNVEANMIRIRRMNESGRYEGLNRRPRIIDAGELREILARSPPPQRPKAPPGRAQARSRAQAA